MAPLSNVLKTTMYLFVVASFATLIGYYRLVSIESAHLTARVQQTNEQDQASHHDSIQSLREADMNITKAGFAASLGKDWDFQSRRVVEWPDPLVSKFEFNRAANSSKNGRPEVVIAMNRKSLSASNFAFAKSKSRGEQSLVGCLPGGREQLAPLYDILPKDDPFRGQKFGSCAVVGNSGILARSGCGPEIDAHDVVFRINEGRTGYSKGKGGFTTTARATEKFSIDVGSKTTLRMILGELAMKETEETSGSNALYMDPPGAMRMLAWPCPQGEGHTAWVQQSHIKEKIMRTIAGIRKDKRQDTGIMFLSPEPLLQLRRSLQLPPNTPDPSLGLQIAAVAMNVCGRVSLYGFNRTSNPYHYWDEKEVDKSTHPFAQSKKSSSPSSLLVWSEEDAVMESLGRLCPLVCLQTKKCRKRNDPTPTTAPPALDTTPATAKRQSDALAQLRSALQGELEKGDDDDDDVAGATAAAEDPVGFDAAPAKKPKAKKGEAAASAASAAAQAAEAEADKEFEAEAAAAEAGAKGKGKGKGRKMEENTEPATPAAGGGGGEDSFMAKFRAKVQQIKAIESGEKLPPPEDEFAGVEKAEAVMDGEGGGKKGKKAKAAAAAAQPEEEDGDGDGGDEGGDEEAPAGKKGKKEEKEELRMEEVNPFAALHAKMKKSQGGAASAFGRDETDDAPVDLPVWGAFGEIISSGPDDDEDDSEDDNRPLRREPEESDQPAAAAAAAAATATKPGKKEKPGKAPKQGKPARGSDEEGEEEQLLITAPDGTWDEPPPAPVQVVQEKPEVPEFLKPRNAAPVFDQAALEEGLNGGSSGSGSGKRQKSRAAETIRARGEVDRDVAELDEMDNDGPKRPHGLFATKLRSDPAAQATEATEEAPRGGGRKGGGGRRGGKRGRDATSSTDDGGRSKRGKGGGGGGGGGRGSDGGDNFFGEESSANVQSDRGSDHGSDASEAPRGRSRRRDSSDSSGGSDEQASDSGGGGGGGFIGSLRRKGRGRGFDPDGYDEHGNPFRSAMLFSGRGRRR